MNYGRGKQWDRVKSAQFDVLIIGGGVSGACLFHHLSDAGYRTLLIDKSDFASATSQASAMMIWGGLLYLKHFKLGTVWRLCGSRNDLLDEKSEWVKPQAFRYLVSSDRPGRALLIKSGLFSYWLMGRCRGERPRRDRDFRAIDFLQESQLADSFVYQEAMLDRSDARFALQWILSPRNTNCEAVNYCSAENLHFNQGTGTWSADLRDHLHGETTKIAARLVVNCAGPWTDEVNAQFGRESPYKHVLSKGVFLGLRRFQNHEQPLIMDTANAKDCMSLIPWGPISLWGPTETCEPNLRGASSATPSDVKYLLTELNRWMPSPSSAHDIISVRNGVRALVVNRVSPPRESTLELSRKFKIYADREVPWISIYGGKMTDCVRLARRGVARIRSRLGEPRTNSHLSNGAGAKQEFTSFPGLATKVLSPRSCVENEMCWTLEDYLRRRTNISQWVPRGGLGRDNENRGYLARIASDFPVCDGMQTPEDQVRKYEERISELDRLIAAC